MICTVLSYGIDRDGVIAELPVKINKWYNWLKYLRKENDLILILLDLKDCEITWTR